MDQRFDRGRGEDIRERLLTRRSKITGEFNAHATPVTATSAVDRLDTKIPELRQRLKGPN